jgi:predicted protein tyrosine phosphatase
MTKEIERGGWNISIEEQKKPYAEQIYTTYRVIEADNKAEADNYMAVTYHNTTESVMWDNCLITVNKCHGKRKTANGRMEFYYIICRQRIS